MTKVQVITTGHLQYKLLKGHPCHLWHGVLPELLLKTLLGVAAVA
jgi:hypothetical protein